MKVVFKRDWFSPEGTLFRAGEEVEISDQHKNILPKDANVVKSSGKKKPSKEDDKAVDDSKYAKEVGDDRRAQEEMDKLLKKKSS